MDIYNNTIDENNFCSTNKPWNEIGLNYPWSIGYVSYLIEQKQFNSKEEWESYYYQSGEKRISIIDRLDSNDSDLLSNFQLHKNQIERISNDLRIINYNYGRTRKELIEKGEYLFEHLKDKRKFRNINKNECIECVRFRVICETWNGIVLREHNTIKNLRQIFSDLEFRKTDSDLDYHCAVDYQTYKNNTLICGLQIKPRSYNSHAPFLQRAKDANTQKNEIYKQKTGKGVYYIFSEVNGDIINKNDLIRFINQLISI